MEFVGKSVRVVVFVVCFVCVVFVVVISLYYIRDYKKKRKKGSILNILDLIGKCEELSLFGEELEFVEILKENGCGEFRKGMIFFLLGMLERVDDFMLEKFFIVFFNCFVFMIN